MLFYTILVSVVALMAHSIHLVYCKRETIVPEASLIQERLGLSPIAERLLNRCYVLVTTVVLMIFFGFVSICAGSLIGMLVFIKA